ncbi:hypothetical protein FD754_003100, partial [Muntiacus muntjak]
SQRGVCVPPTAPQLPLKFTCETVLKCQCMFLTCINGPLSWSVDIQVTVRAVSLSWFKRNNVPIFMFAISNPQLSELLLILLMFRPPITLRRCNHMGMFADTLKVQVLRNAGEEVTLTVSFLKRAPAFLKLSLNEDCACAPSDQSSGTSSPLCDSGLHLNYHPNNTDTLSCSSWPASPGLRWEKRWCDLRLIPLLHSRFSQYLPGTDLSRQNAFQVTAVDGVCSGVIQCLSAEDCGEWLQAIATNISSLTKHNVTTWDWTRAEKTFSVYEIMCKILKDSDLLDRRRHCFTVQSESGEDLYFSVELDSDLAQWERAFQTATFLEVERIQCKTYACVLEGHLMGLTIDFSTGFICFDAATKELEFSNLFAVLHCIHSFFAAKVACLDPLFLSSQAAASAASSSGVPSKAKYMT